MNKFAYFCLFWHKSFEIFIYLHIRTYYHRKVFDLNYITIILIDFDYYMNKFAYFCLFWHKSLQYVFIYIFVLVIIVKCLISTILQLFWLILIMIWINLHILGLLFDFDVNNSNFCLFFFYFFSSWMLIFEWTRWRGIILAEGRITLNVTFSISDPPHVCSKGPAPFREAPSSSTTIKQQINPKKKKKNTITTEFCIRHCSTDNKTVTKISRNHLLISNQSLLTAYRLIDTLTPAWTGLF